MTQRKSLWLPLLALALAACAGGRGSSGFDISEQQVIETVLSTGHCDDHHTLVICPADGNATPEITPTAAAPTPGGPSPTATATAIPFPQVLTGLGGATSIDCAQTPPSAQCTLAFRFAPAGFSAATRFHVAFRYVMPFSNWALAPAIARHGDDYATVVTVDARRGSAPSRVQLAVLAFDALPAAIPASFAELAHTGADSAYVTQTLHVNVIEAGAAATPTPPVTPLPTGSGPRIGYLGISSAADRPLAPVRQDGSGRPVYAVPLGHGISLVVEARPGPSNCPVSPFAVDPEGALPGLQVIVSKPLGDGNPLVCDIAPPTLGGIPATVPLEFSGSAENIAAINDLGCRTDDGTGNPVARAASDACTRDAGGDFRFVDPTSTAQFCLGIAAAWSFPAGDTVVAARVRDACGAVGPSEQIVVRVESGAPPTRTPTSTPPAPPATVAPTPTPLPSPDPAGPLVAYLGLARADNEPLSPAGFDDEGRPIYLRPFGRGFLLVVEARAGSNGAQPGTRAFTDNELPDLQVIVSRPLGDGSPAVCDVAPPQIGGVPATVPFEFSASALAAVNDLGCRASDGTGQPLARSSSSEACTRSNENFGFGFVDPGTDVQFCIPIASAWAFPTGDTVVAVRVRDVGGTIGLAREMIVRVGNMPPSPNRTPAVPPPTPTPPTPESTVAPPSPTATAPIPTPSASPTALPPLAAGPPITHLGLARADDVPMNSIGTDPDGRPIYAPSHGQGFTLIVEARPGASGRPVALGAYEHGELPDLQIVVSQPLGDGSLTVCDSSEPAPGGVPASTILLIDEPSVVDAVNDLGCRVDDGTGAPRGRGASGLACTRSATSFGFSFVNEASTAQFCLPIAGAWSFPPGDTIVSARVRDTRGTAGDWQEIVVRVEP